MKRECTCRDWIEGIESLNAMCFIGQIHGSHIYTGKNFTFCPYCGLPLVEEDGGIPNFCDFGD